METFQGGNGWRAPKVKELRAVSAKKEVDYGAAARGILAQAEAMFEMKREKDAYKAILLALRFYFSKKYTAGQEILEDTRILSMLSRKGLNCHPFESVIRLTSLVDFPEYQPNRNDFNQIMQSAKQAIR
jgi:hypothetical protein